MKIEQRVYDPARGWTLTTDASADRNAGLVLAFGERLLLESAVVIDELRKFYPAAHILIGSASGEIAGTEVTDDRIVATAVAFERTRLRGVTADVSGPDESYGAGRDLALRLSQPELAAVFVVSDGQHVNGTELARGFNEHLPPGTPLSGGLAGDGTRFERTLVGLDGPPMSGRVAAIGFYGASLRVSSGSAGGWEAFGPIRTVSRSDRNTLFELDGQSALGLYKKYLGDQAEHLPGSALRFPLVITPAGAEHEVVRTILSIDEAAQTMTFAGDIPLGARVRFMRASYEDLIGGAGSAAEQARSAASPELVLCVSCVGRKIVLGQRTEEETECVRAALGPEPVIAGFYSYGELAPAGNDIACQLHNQTMTITALREG